MKVAILVNDYFFNTEQTTIYLYDGFKKRKHLVDFVALDIFDEEEVEAYDLWLIRTNPGRDLDRLELHRETLRILNKFKKQVKIINDPESLAKIMSKEYLLDLPKESCPYTCIVKSPYELEVEYLSRPNCLVKPIIGTKGMGIQKVQENEKIDLSSFPMIFQEFIEQKQRCSDKRVFLLNGKPIKIQNQYCVVERVAKSGEFRSNIALGGKAQGATLTSQELLSLARLEPWLMKNNLSFVGADMVEGKVIEINSFSPGGLKDIDSFYGIKFLDTIINFFESNPVGRKDFSIAQ